MATVIKCPVCGNSVSGNVCDKCGWMRLVFPAEAPELLKSFNSEYTETLKRINKTKADSVKKINELEKSASASDEEISRLVAEKKAAQNKISNLEREKEELLKELRESKEHSDQVLVGVVEVLYAPTEKFVFIPIFEGTNTYGTDESSGLHHKVKMRMINDPDVLQPRHFSAYRNSSDGRMYVAPVNGATVYYNGSLLKSPHMVKFSDVIKINDNIQIRVSAC